MSKIFYRETIPPSEGLFSMSLILLQEQPFAGRISGANGLRQCNPGHFKVLQFSLSEGGQKGRPRHMVEAHFCRARVAKFLLKQFFVLEGE